MADDKQRRTVPIEDASDAEDAPTDDASEADADSVELDLDDDPGDVEAVMREAEEAVREVQRGKSSGAAANPGSGADVERLHKELEELRDRSRRTLADFDNFRKRAEREREEYRRYALVDPMRELLEVVDNLERATEAEGSVDDLRQGVTMIVQQLERLLQRHGVEPVPAEGEPFDPAVHEAVSRQDSDDVSVATVAAEHQKGYRIHDRLLRPAMVTVAVPTGGGRSGSTEGGDPASAEA